MRRLLIVSGMTMAVIAVYVLRLDHVAGLYKDDAYYMVLAKALASGEGYALINATPPILPAFPPGFPILLAPVFALVPRYPDTVIWLKAVSIVAMLGATALTYYYFSRYRAVERGQAATVALLAALTPGFVFLATSTVMAECVFTCALMGSAVAIERAARADDPKQFRRLVVCAALIATGAWLTRSAGVAAVGGGALFLASRRGWRASAGFLAVCALAYAPWAIYSAAHNPSAAERAAHGGSVAYSYGELLQARSPGNVTVGKIGLTELPARIRQNVVNVFAHDLGAVIFPAAYRGPAESGLEVFMLSGETGLDAGSMGGGTSVVVISLAVTMLTMVGGLVLWRRESGVAEYFCVITVAMLLLLPARTYRYVLPIAPFLFGYFLLGLEAVAERLRAGSGVSTFRIVAACLLFFLAAEHGQYLWRKFEQPQPPWIEDGRDVGAVADFINLHVPADGTAVSTNPALLYLLTGHKAVAYVDPIERWERWRAADIRYAVALHAVPKPSSRLGYQLLYESPRLGLWVLKFDPRVP